MSLSPLPENNTKRYFLLYTVKGQNHRIQSRCSDSQTDGQAVDYFQAVAAALESIASSDTVYTNVAVALKGSDVVNPVAGLTPVTGTGSGIADSFLPRSLGFAGRASSGRKVKAFLYGFSQTDVGLIDTWEQEPITIPEFQGFQGLLNSQSDFWLAIDAVKPVWYDRFTVTFNDHFVDAARS